MCAALAPPPSLTLAGSRCLLSLTLGSVDGPWLYVHGFSSRYWPHRLAFSLRHRSFTSLTLLSALRANTNSCTHS